mmetsp:Transcript_44298/g.122621  ORF Transcript_44298/g.122621 Transcript_44298/m.122621 type:complete len:211 (+) Transcript_44298:3-635(+)
MDIIPTRSSGGSRTVRKRCRQTLFTTRGTLRRVTLLSTSPSRRTHTRRRCRVRCSISTACPLCMARHRGTHTSCSRCRPTQFIQRPFLRMRRCIRCPLRRTPCRRRQGIRCIRCRRRRPGTLFILWRQHRTRSTRSPRRCSACSPTALARLRRLRMRSCRARRLTPRKCPRAGITPLQGRLHSRSMSRNTGPSSPHEVSCDSRAWRMHLP